jgi:hypothetical protein
MHVLDFDKQRSPERIMDLGPGVNVNETARARLQALAEGLLKYVVCHGRGSRCGVHDPTVYQTINPWLIDK